MKGRGIAKLFQPMIDSTSRKDLQGGFDRLKALLERTS